MSIGWTQQGRVFDVTAQFETPSEPPQIISVQDGEFSLPTPSRKFEIVHGELIFTKSRLHAGSVWLVRVCTTCHAASNHQKEGTVRSNKTFSFRFCHSEWTSQKLQQV